MPLPSQQPSLMAGSGASLLPATMLSNAPLSNVPPSSSLVYSLDQLTPNNVAGAGGISSLPIDPLLAVNNSTSSSSSSTSTNNNGTASNGNGNAAANTATTLHFDHEERNHIGNPGSLVGTTARPVEAAATAMAAQGAVPAVPSNIGPLHSNGAGIEGANGFGSQQALVPSRAPIDQETPTLLTHQEPVDADSTSTSAAAAAAAAASASNYRGDGFSYVHDLLRLEGELKSKEHQLAGLRRETLRLESILHTKEVRTSRSHSRVGHG